MSAHITIRVSESIKQDLEFLARLVGKNVSEIIREVILLISKIKTSIEAINNLEKMEKAFIEAIISLPEFQEILTKLWKFLRTERVAVGFSGEKIEEYTVLQFDYTITMKEGKYLPAKIEAVKDSNEYGTTWIAYIDIKPIESIKELMEFLKEAEERVDEVLRTKIQEIKDTIRDLLK